MNRKPILAQLACSLLLTSALCGSAVAGDRHPKLDMWLEPGPVMYVPQPCPTSKTVDLVFRNGMGPGNSIAVDWSSDYVVHSARCVSDYSPKLGKIPAIDGQEKHIETITLYFEAECAGTTQIEFSGQLQGEPLDLDVELLTVRCNESSGPGPGTEVVKWSQRPDTEDSDDRLSMHALDHPDDLVVHDDWECTDPCAVVGLRWWGSYLEDPNDEYAPRGARNVPFELSWHGNVPADGETPSHPDEAILFAYVDAVETAAFVDGSGKQVYKYVARLDPVWEQEEGTIYWLDVALDPFDERWNPAPEDVPTWGWSKAVENWGDQAIQNKGWHFGPWDDPEDILLPDRAFEIIVAFPIPAVTEWGLVVMLLLVVAAGTIVIRRRRAAVA